MEGGGRGAGGELTKPARRTGEQVEAELGQWRQGNVDLKTGAFARQFTAGLAAEGAQRTYQTAGPPRRDVGVQCGKCELLNTFMNSMHKTLPGKLLTTLNTYKGAA